MKNNVETKLRRVLERLLLILAIFILGFGVYSFDELSPRWGAAILILHSLPLLFYFKRLYTAMNIAIWVSLFMMIQSFLPPDDYVTLKPVEYSVKIQGESLAGMEGVHEIAIDRYGYRTTKQIDYERKSVLRVFTLGGSTTFNVFLDNRLTWNHHLQESLSEALGKPVEVINAGISGTRANNHLATLKRIRKYEPDLVTFLVGVNDWNAHVSGHFKTFSERVSDHRQQLFFSTSRLGILVDGYFIGPLKMGLKATAGDPSKPEVADRTAREPRIVTDFDNVQRDSLNRPLKHIFRPASVSRDYRSAVTRISEECKRLDIPCLFISQPSGYRPEATSQLRTKFWMTPPQEDYTLDFDSLVRLASVYNTYLKDFAQQRGHPFCDIASQMAPSTDYFVDEVHFNVRGSRKVAELLLPCVLSALSFKGR